MEPTTRQLEVLFNCWALASVERGVVLHGDAEAEAEVLAEAGWLEQRTVDDSDDTAWFWTPAAELALNLHQLTDTEGRHN